MLSTDEQIQYESESTSQQDSSGNFWETASAVIDIAGNVVQIFDQNGNDVTDQADDVVISSSTDAAPASDNNTLYYILGAIFIIIVVLMVYLLLRKKK